MADFRKCAIEAAADAIQQRWNAEDAATLIFVDQRAFFEELAALALKAGAEAQSAPLVLIGKTNEGAAVKIEAWDKGDIIPGCDEFGRRFEVYTTYFRGPDWEEYVQVDKWKAESNVDKIREEADLACLASHGIDPASIEVL